MPNDSEEKLIFSFQINNCMKEHYYQISICDDKENFETDKILCENDGASISFKKKMEYIFIFEKRQKITLIITKQYMFNKAENINTAKFVYLANIVTTKNGIYETNLNNDFNTETIQIKVQKNEENKEKRYLFDYLRSGIKLSCFISFDFSQKNNSKNKDDNLNILKNIFEFIEGYTEDHHYYASGFGAKNKGSQNPAFDLDEFKLNSDKLIEKYKVFLESNNIIPEKNIALSPIIKKITSDTYQSYEPNNYYVVFVLISKDIDKKDKKNLIHQIIASSYLPLSIFIIGIGNHNFTESKTTLKKISKYSNEGMEKVRDNVIFTTYNSVTTANKTISLCLRELSKQMVQYYILNKYIPESDDNNNNIKDSINLYISHQDNINNNKNKSSESNSENQFQASNSSPIENNVSDTPNPPQVYSYNPSFNNNSNNINNSSNSNNINNNIKNSNNSNNSHILKSSDFNAIEENVENPYTKKKVDKSGASGSTFNSKNSGQ